MEYPLWRPVDLDKTPNAYDVAGFRVSGKDIFAAAGIPPELKKALDSTGAAPMIRQDLDPQIYEIFVKKFPFFDMITKEPANGLVHAFNQQTAYGDALFMTETGDVTDDANTYARQTANIAVIATRRGVTLKAQYAVKAGGMAYDAEAREIAGALIAMKNKMQAAIFRYQDTNSAATTPTDPDGLYDANAFNGLRYILTHQSPAGNTISVDVSGSITGTPVTDAIDRAANAVIDAGGEPDLIVSSVSGMAYLKREQLPLVRFVNPDVEVIPGLRVQQVAAGEALLPLLRVPGGGVGTYTTGGTTSFADIYVLDTSTLSLAYLGGPTPTILDIPIGVDGKLRHLYIAFGMWGLVCYSPAFQARVKLELHA